MCNNKTLKQENTINKSLISFIVTMDIAVDLLNKEIINGDEYEIFLEKMTTKYKQKNLQVLYQIKLDIYRDKRVNTSAKGAI